jgi:magnesium-transporting ATPase (P-type)
MDSDSDKNTFLSQLRERADAASQKLNAKLLNNVEKLKDQFKAKLNFISVVVFIVILIILLFFIIIGIYIPTKDIYFTIIQYITVFIFFLILLTFYVVNRPIVIKKDEEKE